MVNLNGLGNDGFSNGGRVISQRVIGSSNPVARYFRNIVKSVGGMIFGLVLFFGSFGVMYYSENFTKHSEIIAALPMSESSALTDGQVKFEGPVEVVSYAYAKPDDVPVLYSSYTEQVCTLEVYTEKQVITQNGQDIEQTIEKERNVWKGEPMVSWAEFKVGGVPVEPSVAKHRLTLKTISQVGDFSSSVCTIGAIRKKTEAFVSDVNTKLLVVGDYINGKVSGGNTYFISDLSNDMLIAKLQQEENTLFWMLKGGATLAFALGLTLIVSPVLMLLNILPGLGKFLQVLVFVASLLLGLLVVTLSTIILKLWWLIVIAIIAFLVWSFKKKKQMSATAQ